MLAHQTGIIAMLVGVVLLGLLLDNRAEACDMVRRIGRDRVLGVSGQCTRYGHSGGSHLQRSEAGGEGVKCEGGWCKMIRLDKSPRRRKRSGTMHVPAARPMSERRLGDHRTSGVISQAVRQPGRPSSRVSALGHGLRLSSRHPTSCVDDGG